MYTQKKGLSKRAKHGLVVLIIILAVGITALCAQLFMFKSNKRLFRNFLPSTDKLLFSRTFSKRFKTLPSSFHFEDYIAVLYIEGVIEEQNTTYNQQWLLNTIEKLTDDDRNCGIVLFINSPGGGVYQSDEVYAALQNYKHRTDNQVWAYMGSLAASGGYYIACAADIIYANRNTLTGSIGVISSSSVDLTELMAKHGIKMTTITAGKNKNMLNINSPLTEEQRAVMQSIADEAYDQFTGIVAESRKMDIKKVRRLADGRIYTAQQAKNNGLIDYIDYYENAIDNITDLFEQNVSIEEFRVPQKRTFQDYLYQAAAFAGFKAKPAEAQLIDAFRKASGLPENLPLPAYYFCFN
ncbi:signal peptide peptidase SppA [Treponema lecithinolyticum]|uniref:Signal peptide peptidase SppA n=1 Tax=Treponema lecithinolyticum ATCC 700332 TaxID=1321815 RepID=A0ABN0NYZ2_TRELE|nr:signal peptide peptidase SppA [Treponema lecithinolyticum]ERJ93296.1 signal peptide peptidase SppA [Treponema lecithinolyticum ATCC 700332]